jgi:hypothetical protein
MIPARPAGNTMIDSKMEGLQSVGKDTFIQPAALFLPLSFPGNSRERTSP